MNAGRENEKVPRRVDEKCVTLSVSWSVSRRTLDEQVRTNLKIIFHPRFPNLQIIRFIFNAEYTHAHTYRINLIQYINLTARNIITL